MGALAGAFGWSHWDMWRMPYILLRWYALQSRRQLAHRDLRRLDAVVLSLCDDPGELHEDMRRDLEYAYHTGMQRPQEILTPGEFRLKVDDALGAFDNG